MQETFLCSITQTENIIKIDIKEIQMKIEGTRVWGFENATIGMRLPMSLNYEEAKSKCDSAIYEDGTPLTIGKSDLKVMKNLVNADNLDGYTGAPNSKYLRMIHVQVAVTAPLYWWKEMDTYKICTVRNSSSTMHKLASTPITIDCFEMDDFTPLIDNFKIDLSWQTVVSYLEQLRQKYNETKDKCYWKELIRLLPESWLQTSVLDLNYETLRNIYAWRKNHKLTEWHTFCDWIKTLPYAEELILNDKGGKENA